MVNASQTEGIRITPIPILAQGGSWRIEAMRSYSSDLLLWFTRGQGRITVAGETRGYGAFNAVYIPAGTMHGFSMNASAFGTAAFIHPDLNLGFPDQYLQFRIQETYHQAELTGLLENLKREIEKGELESGRAIFHHAGLLGVWLARARQKYSHTAKPRTKEPLVARYTALIEQDFKTGRSVTDYAAALGITPTHLTRLCKQSCGKSASALLSDRLMFEARRQLRDTRAPVQKISDDLGFGSASYFSRVFQNQTGMSPSAFRKARRE